MRTVLVLASVCGSALDRLSVYVPDFSPGGDSFRLLSAAFDPLGFGSGGLLLFPGLGSQSESQSEFPNTRIGVTLCPPLSRAYGAGYD